MFNRNVCGVVQPEVTFLIIEQHHRNNKCYSNYCKCTYTLWATKFHAEHNNINNNNNNNNKRILTPLICWALFYCLHAKTGDGDKMPNQTKHVIIRMTTIDWLSSFGFSGLIKLWHFDVMSWYWVLAGHMHVRHNTWTGTGMRKVSSYVVRCLVLETIQWTIHIAPHADSSIQPRWNYWEYYSCYTYLHSPLR